MLLTARSCMALYTRGTTFIELHAGRSQVPAALPSLRAVIAMLPPLPDNVPGLEACRAALDRQRLPLTALDELVMLAGDVSVMGSRAVAR